MIWNLTEWSTRSLIILLTAVSICLVAVVVGGCASSRDITPYGADVGAQKFFRTMESRSY